MSIFNFASSLLSKFGRNRLKEDLNIIKTELSTIVIPAYNAATPFQGEGKLLSKRAQDFEKQWFINVPGTKKNKGLVVSIKEKVETLVPLITLLDTYIDKEFEDIIITSGITVSKATCLRMVEVIGFLSTYSIKLLNYLYVLEINEKKNVKASSTLTKGEIDLLDKHFLEFCVGIKMLCKEEPKATVKRLENIPEILVNAAGEISSKTSDKNVLDSTGVFAVKGFTYNPIYHVSLFVAEWQANRYKRNKELKTMLELRLLNLQQVMNETDDPAVEKEIAIIQSRLDKLDYAIRDAEESVNV